MKKPGYIWQHAIAKGRIRISVIQSKTLRVVRRRVEGRYVSVMWKGAICDDAGLEGTTENLRRNHLLVIIDLIAERKLRVVVARVVVLIVVSSGRRGSRGDNRRDAGRDHRGSRCRSRGGRSRRNRSRRDTSRRNGGNDGRIGDADNLADVQVRAFAVDVWVVRPQHRRVDTERARDTIACVAGFHDVCRGTVFADGTEAYRLSLRQIGAPAVDLRVDCGELVRRGIVGSADAVTNVALCDCIATSAVRGSNRIGKEGNEGNGGDESGGEHGG